MSGTWPISGLEACELIKHGYYEREKLDIQQMIDIAGVQASIVNTQQLKALLIQGTNEKRDWLAFNLRFWPRREEGDRLAWHGGFLRYAQMVYAFAKYKDVKVVVGHSLGAAAAQIVGLSLGVPTIAVASPRPLHKDKAEESDLIVNLCRTDDTVCDVPFSWWGYRHVGKVHWFTPASRHAGEDHRIPHYIEILNEQGDPLESRQASAAE